jgi:hypothetical protein
VIVSTFEGICIRLVFGAVVDAIGHGRLEPDDRDVEWMLNWCSTPGVTRDGQIEIDNGEPVGQL